MPTILLDPLGDIAIIFLIYFHIVTDINLTFITVRLANKWNISLLSLSCTLRGGEFLPKFYDNDSLNEVLP